jgi:hypothetical protein
MPPQHGEQLVEMGFPVGGIDVSAAWCRQPSHQIMTNPAGQAVMGPSTPTGQNVRGFDPSTNRLRGGSRGGVTKYIAQAVNPNFIVSDLALVVGTGGTLVQFSNSGRVVTVVAVSKGQVYFAPAGATGWTLAGNATGSNPPLNWSGVVFSAENQQKLWYADGVNWVYFDPTLSGVFKWQATAGVLPVDADNNTPKLICTWRGRTVLSGLLKDPQNWFMSAQGDPTDFNYAPLSVTPTQAIAGNNSPSGLVGDLITTLIPYTDDVLIFGGDHTIYMLRGDPMAGGQIDLISDSIGMAWGIPWCKDPYGNLYFFSNRCGIYTLVPGQQPQRISQPIEALVQNIDTGANSIRLIWDDRFQGLHVFVSPLVSPAATTHFFFEQRTGAWWTDVFSNPNLDPIAMCVFDGNLPNDRRVLVGSWDGFVRNFTDAAATDDGNVINSAVVLGPIVSAELDDFLLKDLQAVLGETSGSVNFAVYVGKSAEAALATSPVVSGVWNPSRNLNTPIRWSGHAVFVKITSTNQWALEQIRARFTGTGKVRRRSY